VVIYGNAISREGIQHPSLLLVAQMKLPVANLSAQSFTVSFIVTVARLKFARNMSSQGATARVQSTGQSRSRI
jgi:hypothetical protein